MAARLLTALLGAWLMAAPAVLHYGGNAAANDRIVGPLTLALAVIALFPATRGLRWINLVLGIWLVIAAWLFFPQWPLRFNDLLTGLAICGLAGVREPQQARLGTGWAGLLR
jgi:hypothetical protein